MRTSPPPRSRVLLLAALLHAGCSSRAQSSDGSGAQCACPPGESCLSGSCERETLACVLPPPTPSAAPAPVQAIALGTHQVGDTLSFSVPAGTASLSIVEQVVSAPQTASFQGAPALPNTPAPLRIVDPGGQVIFDQFQSPS